MLTFAQTTNLGSRPVNEDAAGCFACGGRRCFLVCDGLGGHGMGDVASDLVRTVFRERFSDGTELPDFLPQAFTAAQERLLAEQRRRHVPNRMKTTAAALVFDAATAYIGHIGDTRLYLFAENAVKFRTLDHSVPQLLSLAGQLPEAEIRRHPDRNKLLRVLGGPWEKPMYELHGPVPLADVQAALLCTDGFWEWLEDDAMCALLSRTADAAAWLEAMLAQVRKNAGKADMDNYSAIAIRF